MSGSDIEDEASEEAVITVEAENEPEKSEEKEDLVKEEEKAGAAGEEGEGVTEESTEVVEETDPVLLLLQSLQADNAALSSRLERLDKGQSNLFYRLRQSEPVEQEEIYNEEEGEEETLEQAQERLVDRQNENAQRQEEKEAQEESRNQASQFIQYVNRSEETLKTTTPDYDEVISKARDHRRDLYIQLGYNTQQAITLVGQEVASLLQQAVERGLDPAKEMYVIAQSLNTPKPVLEEDSPKRKATLTSKEDSEKVRKAAESNPSLSQISTGRGPLNKMTWDQFDARTTSSQKVDIAQKFPGFYDALLEFDEAVVPKKLEDIL